jgi:hypothetical protein
MHEIEKTSPVVSRSSFRTLHEVRTDPGLVREPRAREDVDLVGVVSKLAELTALGSPSGCLAGRIRRRSLLARLPVAEPLTP